MSDQIITFDNEETENIASPKRTKRTVILIIVAIVIVLIATFLIINYRHLPPMKFSEWVSDSFIRVGSGDGYPYEVNSNSVRDVAAFNKDSAILTDTSLIILNPSSKEVTNRLIPYSNPVMKTSSDRILIYDIGGNNFSIHNRSSSLFQNTTENAITTCTIGDYGNFAVATRDDVYSGSVTFYSYKFDEMFKWNSGNSYITALALSPDGDYGAAVTLNARSGEAFSTVYIFNFETEEVVSFKFEDTVIGNIVFGRDNQLTAVGDSCITVINTLNDDKESDETYAVVGSLSHISCDNGNAIATVSKVYDNNNIYSIKYINHRYGTQFETTIEEKVYDVYANQKYCAVLTDKSVYLYGYEGNIISAVSIDSLNADSSIHKIFVCESELYALTSSKILQISY
ncbi:MAG: hypothetical protein IKU25_07070 [Clostridia bacterium]|nr:hypothetical protein [Clostridia bacterium]